MNSMKANNMKFILIIIIGNFSAGISAPIDNYPKNPKIDAINYIFNIELSDETDEIICESKVDVRYLEKGIKELRLDLINVQKGKGMKVSRVTSNR
jgi:hypothetical protein